ncbi:MULTISPECIES: phosphoribosylglycinamide formyltransferase [Cytobacillus]|uniref:phosphoribosylglycinamide formyltransferase n=1 Tax=Cytobacillus TaxID=2675230 RepID=UPI00203D4159|nr:phosphoribosylglycinamide formyltransferase [Cytobacillus firmus]MCM3706185.1 phosphoribosylglycinamide formyltransferase [Cytobacillus firmus]
MKKIAVFASGSGTNFQAIADAARKGDLQAEIVLFVCDRPGAYSIQRAQNEGVPQFVFSAKAYEGKAEYEGAILQELKESGAEYIILAGYMRLIGPTLLKEFEGRIINIHPSLLPAFPGKDAIGQALSANVKVSGVTVHFVDEGMDTGPIIAQAPVAIDADETLESLQKKIHEVEHILYPQVLQSLFCAKMVEN